MNTENKSRILIGLLGFSLGLAAMYIGQSVIKQKAIPLQSARGQDEISMNQLLDDIYEDDFFGKSDKSRDPSPDKFYGKMGDPFEQMKRMREHMLKQFDRPETGGGLFDSWFQKKFGGGEVGQITRHEDDKFIYYEVLAKDLKQEKLNVKVEEGQIQISGQTETKSENESSGTYMSSSFHRSLPVPPNVDSNKVQIEQAKDKLVIKFPKMT